MINICLAYTIGCEYPRPKRKHSNRVGIWLWSQLTYRKWRPSQTKCMSDVSKKWKLKYDFHFRYYTYAYKIKPIILIPWPHQHLMTSTSQWRPWSPRAVQKCLRQSSASHLTLVHTFHPVHARCITSADNSSMPHLPPGHQQQHGGNHEGAGHQTGQDCVQEEWDETDPHKLHQVKLYKTL